MQSTLQAALVTAGGADLSGQQTRLYRRRRRGGKLSPYQHQWLNALTPNQVTMLEKTTHDLDEADRELRRARRNGVTVIDGGQVLPPIVSTSARPLARRRGAGRPRARASRSSARSGDSGDDGESPGEADAAYLRGFLLYLIGFDWSEALIDSAYAFSVDIEREVTS